MAANDPSNTQHLLDMPVIEWRFLGDATFGTPRWDFVEWAIRAIDKRVAVGVERYGDEFQGDPLDHAIEEALDLLFYLWVAKRRQQMTNTHGGN